MSAAYTFLSATAESVELTRQAQVSPAFATVWKLSAEPSKSPVIRVKEPSAPVSSRPRCQRDLVGERATGTAGQTCADVKVRRVACAARAAYSGTNHRISVSVAPRPAAVPPVRAWNPVNGRRRYPDWARRAVPNRRW